jgi:hypothetical protein
VSRTRALAGTAAGLLVAVGAFAQFGGPRGPFHERPNVSYDGRFTFVRLKYTTAPGGYWYGGLAGVGSRLSDFRAEPHEHHE